MTAVARVPRALILQPVSKLREEEEDGPLDWLANMFRGMISPRKRQPPYHQPPMLGPIRIPGMDDEVYIKQLGSLANSQSRVIVRMMTPGRGQPGQMSPATYYTYQPVFPAAPTRQIPVQPPGFAPMASPTPTAPWPQPQAMRPHSPTSYNKNMYPSHGYPQPNMYPNQFRPSVPLHQSHYDPPYSPRYTQNPYGTYDFDNSIPHGRGSRFGPDPIRTTNYPLYPPLKDHHNFNGQVHHDHEIRNQSASSEEVYDDSRESDVRYADAESKEILNESKVTDKYKEIYRPDRMVPTNPTWRNRFWTRTHRTTTASPTTEGSEDEGKNKSTKDGKFSSTEIREIVAPDLKDWKERTEKGEREEEKRRTDSRMDEGEGKDGVALGKGESREFVEKRVLSVRMADAASEGPRAYAKIQARKRSNWTPILPKPTQLPVYSGGSQGNSAEVSSTEAARETTTRANEEANATRDHSRRHEGKRHSKVYQRKIGKRDRRVRIVESVSSSVSVSSSRGKGVKPKST
ncbi:ribonuclease 3-like [Diachasma alloeum]|uniref:ribonuclease 3-like n=1 Tax=Diachasma alloeum TaxID=454923 RepID=UPI000738273D|nr:ribonuclease 3-like [Diachasma alloeum]